MNIGEITLHRVVSNINNVHYESNMGGYKLIVPREAFRDQFPAMEPPDSIDIKIWVPDVKS